MATATFEARRSSLVAAGIRIGAASASSIVLASAPQEAHHPNTFRFSELLAETLTKARLRLHLGRHSRSKKQVCVGENGTARPFAQSPPLVLFADDDRDTVDLFGFALGLEGFRVEVSRDGVDALTKVTTLLPHVVVTDLMLPGIDGFELCSRVKRDDRTRGVRMIAVSGMVGVQEKVGEAGFDAFLLKPVAVDSLVARIRETLMATAG